MSTNAATLGNKLLESIKNLEDPTKFWDNFAKTVNDYLEANLEITGAYVGINPKPTPHPSELNGTYTWNVTCNVSGSALFAAIKNSSDPKKTQPQLGSAIAAQIKMQAVIPSAGPVTLASPVLIGCNTISFDFSSLPTQPKDTNAIFAAGILRGIMSTLPNPSGVAAIATDNSIGAVSFISQS